LPLPSRRLTASFVLLVALVATARPTPLEAHDIPQDVTIQAILKPEGDRLRLVIRVPLKSILDVEYPRRERDYVDVARIGPTLREVATRWIASEIEMYEGARPLDAPRLVTARLSLESERAFDTFDEAVAHVTGSPLPDDTTLFWEQGLLDALFEYPITSARSEFSIHAALDRLGLRVATALQFITPDGAVRVYRLPGDSGLVRLDPRWHQAAGRFVHLGFVHILEGLDHLLFLLCLVIPLRRFGSLVPVVTSFTIAHSITLIASAYDLAPTALWFPPLVEALIALSIVYMAIENIVSTKFERRWLVAFGFGLVHGFGFSFALREALQFAGAHLLASLLAFNVGVELGQLLVLTITVPVLVLLFRKIPERTGTIILSALVAHTAWHWLTERVGVLSEFPLVWAPPGPAEFAAFLRLGMVVLAAVALVWLLFGRGHSSSASPRHGADDDRRRAMGGAHGA
jgi:HupE / UreJ protein